MRPEPREGAGQSGGHGWRGPRELEGCRLSLGCGSRGQSPIPMWKRGLCTGGRGVSKHTHFSHCSLGMPHSHTHGFRYTHTDKHTYKAPTTPARMSIHTGTSRHVTKASPERHTNSDTDTLTHARHICTRAHRNKHIHRHRPAFTQTQEHTHTCKCTCRAQSQGQVDLTHRPTPRAHVYSLPASPCLTTVRSLGPEYSAPLSGPCSASPVSPGSRGCGKPVQPGPGGACS